MGLSETILAAMIGAAATVGTALFQLLTAFKASRGKTDTKPKRGTTLRSILAVLALMTASAAGGFLYSQLLREREAEDIRAMRQEMRELRDMTAARAVQPQQQFVSAAPAPAPKQAAPLVPVDVESTNGVAESIAYVPACRKDATQECEEADAQRIALCGTIPSRASVSGIRLYAQPDAVQKPWDLHAATLEADIGGARFTGQTFEYAQGLESRAVCVNFTHWNSQHPHIARIVVEFATDAAGDSTLSPVMEQPVLTSTTITAEALQAAPQPAAFTTPAIR